MVAHGRRDLARGAAVSASSLRKSSPESDRFGAACVVDGNPATYWATDDGVLTAALTLQFKTPTRIGIVRIDECIALGQRVAKFHVDAMVDGAWKTVTQGTTIGARRILRFDPVDASAVRVVIDETLAAPCISAVQLFAPRTIPCTSVSHERRRSLRCTSVPRRWWLQARQVA